LEWHGSTHLDMPAQGARDLHLGNLATCFLAEFGSSALCNLVTGKLTSPAPSVPRATSIYARRPLSLITMIVPAAPVSD
jgi:hypothetical protein